MCGLYISFNSQTLILTAEYFLLSVVLTVQSYIYQTKSICCPKSALSSMVPESVNGTTNSPSPKFET